MERFRKESPKIPIVGRAAHTRARVALDCVIQIREFKRVTQKEHRGIVTYEVPISLVGIKPHGKPTYIPFRICRPTLSGHRRKPHKAFCFLPDFGKYGSAGEFRNIVCHGKDAECARTFGMHAPFRDNLAVEVCNLFGVPWILEQNRPANPGCLDVLIIGNRPAVFSGKSLFMHIWQLIGFVKMIPRRWYRPMLLKRPYHMFVQTSHIPPAPHVFLSKAYLIHIITRFFNKHTQQISTRLWMY